MLSLKTWTTAAIAKSHFEGVDFYINQALDYYINVFDILDGNRAVADSVRILYNESDLNGNTLNALGKRLCFNVANHSAVTKGNIVNILSNVGNNLNPLFRNNFGNWLAFFKKLKTSMESVIISRPQELLKLESELKGDYPILTDVDGLFKEAIKEVLLYGIFNYTKFSDKTGLPIDSNNTGYWERYNLAKALNVNTCAYCNRIYTFTIISVDGNGVISPTMDHFFDKSKHPLFALSFYNLIPSCTNCNSTLKLDKKFSLDKYVHPYMSGFGELAKFNYTPLDVASSLGVFANLEISITPESNSPIETQITNSIELFQLDIIYTEHADYVQELIMKKVVSNSRYLEILRNETYNGLDLSIEDSYRLAFGNYYHERDFQKRPLAKLTKDIAEYLGMG